MLNFFQLIGLMEFIGVEVLKVIFDVSLLGLYTVRKNDNVCDYWLCFYRDLAIDRVLNDSDSCAAQLCFESQIRDCCHSLFRFTSVSDIAKGRQ
jgi:hypothetical protein